MKFTYSSIQKLAGHDIPAAELAERLTMVGLEVSSVEPMGDDYVFTVEITSNRPDWLSLIGIAHEVAAISGTSVAYPDVKSIPEKTKEITIEIKDDTAEYYTGVLIKGAKAAPSPGWLRRELESVGIRSINNIVDATNYTMLLFGQPLHVFDAAKVEKGSIIVRYAKEGEKIITLDGAEHMLAGSDIVIADPKKAIALAGIMGCANSEVSFSTKDIILESAVFPRVSIRRTRQRLAINTEASYRFERGIDGETCLKAAAFCAALICELSGAKIIGKAEKGSPLVEPRRIDVEMDFIRRYSGILDLAEGPAKKILAALGFSTEEKDGVLSVQPPHFRRDVAIKEDVVEEVVRIYGYDKVPLDYPRIGLNTLRSVGKIENENKARLCEALTKNGFYEAVSFSLIGKKKTELCPVNPLTLANYISEEYMFLRTSILPGLLDAVAYNNRHKMPYVRFFEIAQLPIAKPLDKKREYLGLIAAEESKHEAFFAVKLAIEDILDTLFTSNTSIDYSNGEWKIFCGRQALGYIKIIGKDVLDRYDIQAHCVYAEIALGPIIEKAPAKTYQPLPVYPAIERDVSMWIDNPGIMHRDILSVIKRNGGGYLVEVSLIDVFEKNGQRSYAYRLIFRSPEKTLKDEDVQKDFDAIIKALSLVEGLRLRIK